MKLQKLSITKTRSTGDSVTSQKNGRIRISASLAEKLNFKEGDSIDLFIDEDNKNFLYVCSGSMYKLFKHVKGSNSGIYFGSISMFKELGIEELSLHSLTSKLMKFKDTLYLQLDLSEMLPKVLKPVTVEKQEDKPEEKPTNNSRNRNKPTTTAAPKEEEPTFL